VILHEYAPDNIILGIVGRNQAVVKQVHDYLDEILDIDSIFIGIWYLILRYEIVQYLKQKVRVA